MQTEATQFATSSASGRDSAGGSLSHAPLAGIDVGKQADYKWGVFEVAGGTRLAFPGWSMTIDLLLTFLGDPCKSCGS
jgi:hypothetical protein